MTSQRLSVAFALLLSLPALAGEPPADPILRLEAGMHTAGIRQIIADQPSHLVLTTSEDKSARVWDLTTGQLLRVLRPPAGAGNEGKLYNGDLAVGGALAALGGWTCWEWDSQGCIYIFEPRSGALIRRIGGMPNIPQATHFSKDGRFVAVGLAGSGNGMRVFRVSDGTEIGRDTDYQGDVYGLDWDPSGRIVTASYDGKLRLYDAGYRRIATAQSQGGHEAFRCKFSPDGSKIAIAYTDTSNVDVVSGYDLSLLYRVPTPQSYGGAFAKLGWVPDTGELVTGATWKRPSDNIRMVRRYQAGGQGSFEEIATGRNTIMGLQAMQGGGIAWATSDPSWGVTRRDGSEIIGGKSPVADHRDIMVKVSYDGQKIYFGWNSVATATFSVAERNLLVGAADTGLSAARLEAPGVNIQNWRDNAHPTVNGIASPVANYELSRYVAVEPDNQHFILGSDWNLRRFDTAGKQLWEIPSPGTTWSVNVTPDGQLAVGAFGDGTVRWFRISDGKELLAFFPHGDRRRWVLWTASGYYDASPGGEDLIGWQVNRGKEREADFFPAARFRSRFYRPDVVSRILQTRDEAEAIRIADSDNGRKANVVSVLKTLPPVTRILSPTQNENFSGGTVSVRVSVRSPSGAEITAVRALVDGRPAAAMRGVKIKTAAEGSEERTLEVPVPARDCIISVLAEAGDVTGDADAVQIKYFGAPAGQTIAERSGEEGGAVTASNKQVDGGFDARPKLYVLAVGVSKYKNKEMALDYPAKDARDVAKALSRQKGRLYRDVVTKVITDENATKDGVLDGLEWLQKQTTARDMAVLFLAGHGVNDPSTGQYQYLPVGADVKRMRATMLPGSEIKTTLASIAGKAVLLLDTCHSGNVLGDKKLRGASDMNGFINELTSAENGVVVFSAASGKQSSQESKSWGNGAFTKAFLEAMGGKADYNHSGRITVNMVDLYISERVKELTHGEQTPVTAKPGTVPDFPIAATQ